MSTPVRIGIIGLGAISAAHIPNYQKDPRAELFAICDSDERWLARQKEALGVTHAFADYHALLKNGDVDAVVVCLPTWLHAQATIDALNAGKHVLCEKPMACTGEEARAMKRAAEASGKKLMISHNQRFGQDIQYLAALHRQGFFGDLYFMRLAWRRPPGMMPTPDERRADGSPYNRNWFNERDKGGGVLRDLGSHLLDLAMHITGFPKLQSASASCYRKFRPAIPEEELARHVFDSEDLAAAHLKFEGGLSIQLEVSFGSMIEEEVLLTELYGTRAGASRRMDGVKLFRKGEDAITTESVKRFIKPAVLPDEAFLASILNGAECPVTPAEGVHVIDILDAIYESGRN